MGDNTYPELTLEKWMYRLCGVDVGMYCQKHPRLLHLFYNNLYILLSLFT